MRVLVLRVSGMPHSVQVLAFERPDCVTLYVNKALVTEEDAKILESRYATPGPH